MLEGHVTPDEMSEHSKLGQGEIRLESRMRLVVKFAHKAIDKPKAPAKTL